MNHLPPASGIPLWVQSLVRNLAALQPNTLTLSPEANAVRREVEELMMALAAEEGLGEGFNGMAGKLTGVFGTLCLLIHVIERPTGAAMAAVSGETAMRAQRIVKEFIVPHGLELHRMASDGAGGDGELVRKVASFILTSKKDRVLPSDFTSNIRELRGMGSMEVAQKVSALVAGGWLEPVERGPTPRAWTVNPGVRAAMAERGAQEAERKARVKDLIRQAAEKRRAEKEDAEQRGDDGRPDDANDDEFPENGS